MLQESFALFPGDGVSSFQVIPEWVGCAALRKGSGGYRPAKRPEVFLSLSLQDYPKLSQSYYSLLEVLTQDHMNFIASLEPHVIMYILSSISEGLTALGNYLCSLSRS